MSETETLNTPSTPNTTEKTPQPAEQAQPDPTAERLEKAYSVAAGEPPQAPQDEPQAKPDASPPEEGKKPQEPAQKPISQQWAALKRQRGQVARKERELAEREKVILQHEELEKLRQSDPIAWAEKTGVNVRDWALKLVNEEEPTKESEALTALQKEFAEYKAQQEQTALEAQRTQADRQAVAMFAEEYKKNVQQYTHIAAYEKMNQFSAEDVAEQALELLEQEYQQAQLVEPVPDPSKWARENLPLVLGWIDEGLKQNLERERERLTLAGLIPENATAVKSVPAQKGAATQGTTQAAKTERPVQTDQTDQTETKATLSNADASERSQANGVGTIEERLQRAYEIARTTNG